VPIRFFAMSTRATRSRRIARVNQANWDARPCRLVTDIASQLGESPAMPFVAVFVTNRDTLSNTSQVFKSECLARYYGLFHQEGTDAMIRILLKAFFTPTHLFETTFGGARPDLLQGLTTLLVAPTHLAYLRSAKCLAERVSGQVDDAQIHTERLGALSARRSILALGNIEVVGATPPQQIRSTNDPFRISQHAVLARAHDQAAHDASGHRVEGDAVKTHKAVGACIVAKRAMWAEVWTGLAVPGSCGFDRLNRLRTCADSQLSTQTKARAGLSVDAVMGRVGIGDPLFKAHLGNPRSGCIERSLRLLQRIGIPVYIKLYADRPYESFIHTNSVAEPRTLVKKGRWQGIACCGTWQFLPWLKPRGFLAISL
jgi:hypothetical protein